MTIGFPFRSTPALEQKKRFSESLLWQWQQNYFEKQGINAWVGQIPFYVTSNPFIANCYAKIVLRFIRDWLNQHPDAKNHPFYIMELGTGSGRFSFYVLKALHDMRECYGLQDITLKYVMTDFTNQNLDFYQNHHAFAPYLEKGFVDFAKYNMEKEHTIKLINSGVEINQTLLKNPLILFANYIFDTVSQDMFSVKQKKLSEVLVSISTDKNNLNEGNPINFNKLNISYSENEITLPYYNDKELDAILEMYQEHLTNSSFLIPIGSIRALRWLKKLANNKLFLIASDKAFNTLDELDNNSYPFMAFHGCFSMTVNLHAIKEYVKMNNGDSYSQISRSNLQTCVASIGFKLDNLSDTKIAIKESLDGFSPSDYLNMHKLICDAIHLCDINILTSHLLFAGWDPHIFLKMSSYLSTIVENEDRKAVRFLVANMQNIADNYYYLPKTECVLFEIGVFYHSLKEYQEALAYYHQAEQFVGEQFGVHYNSALCLFHTKQYQEALTRLQRALTLEPDSKDVKEWITYINKLIIM